MSLKTLHCSLPAVAALTASLLMCASNHAWAQRARPPQLLPHVTAQELARIAVRRGNLIVPNSSLENSSNDGSSLHTHIVFGKRLAEDLAANLSIDAASLINPLNLSLAAPISLLAAAENAGQQPEVKTGYMSTFSPNDLKTAYGLPATGGSGTIVLIGAYHYATALSDFNAFASYYGLPQESSTNPLLNANSVFQVVYATGRQPPAPPANMNYNLEAALDIEWAHALAPNAKIVLVEALSNTTYDLIYAAVEKANNLPGVKEISISYGTPEFASETYVDATFTHSGIVYFASSGDTGGEIEWPSCSPNVVGVGGTSLYTNSTDNSYNSESGWSGSGGGISAYEARPSYQSTITVNSNTTYRDTPDVALVADPDTGVAIISNSTWYYNVGGTSLSAPATAAIVNLSGTFRASSNAELTNIYTVYNNAALYPANFHDITTGMAGSFSCLVGYDLVTGVGTPKGTGGF